jgi:hypothetical protein
MRVNQSDHRNDRDVVWNATNLLSRPLPKALSDTFFALCFDRADAASLLTSALRDEPK